MVGDEEGWGGGEKGGGSICLIGGGVMARMSEGFRAFRGLSGEPFLGLTFFLENFEAKAVIPSVKREREVLLVREAWLDSQFSVTTTQLLPNEAFVSSRYAPFFFLLISKNILVPNDRIYNIIPRNWLAMLILFNNCNQAPNTAQDS